MLLQCAEDYRIPFFFWMLLTTTTELGFEEAIQQEAALTLHRRSAATNRQRRPHVAPGTFGSAGVRRGNADEPLLLFGQFYGSKTKILEGRTNVSECVFGVLFVITPLKSASRGNAFGKFMLPKRRVWKSEQTFQNAYSKHFSRV